MRLLSHLGGLVIFLAAVGRIGLRTRGNLRPILEQVSSVCYRSLGTVLLAGAFVGAILVLQFHLMLSRYGAESMLGGLNTSALIREVGPLIISFLLAGKIGAFTAAELGTMRVTEQVDAIRCLGTDPLQYLVLPRFVAIVISSVILLTIGLAVSVAGSMLVASVLHGINPLQFASGIPRFSGPWTLFSGFTKSLVYGTIVAGVSCYQGYTASHGAKGVGRAVTLGAIYTNFYIVLANFVTSHVLEGLERLLDTLNGRPG